jgi:Mycothiol maleylpyruvate isomerase N-terminal domain
MTGLRELYLATGRACVDLIAEPGVATGWERPSVLPRLSIGELAAHLARSVLQVEWFLGEPDPGSPRPWSASAYYADLEATADLDSPLNVGVRERSREVSVTGPDQVLQRARASLALLADRLTGPDPVPESRQLLVHGDRPLVVGEYLRTRLVELAIHDEDLRLSLDPGSPAPSRLPAAAVGEAVEVLVGAARLRHGDAAVLRALARRERDGVQALRPL